MSKKIPDAAEKAAVLVSAPPPWHSVATIVGLVAIFVSVLPTLEQLDQAATLKTFTERVFADQISLRGLGYIRLLFAATIWLTSIYSILSPGFVVSIVYPPGSKLKNATFKLKGLRNLAPFTHWSWIMLGISFSLGSYICLVASNGKESKISPMMLRVALVSWEIASPVSFLVSAVVRYAIWPKAMKSEMAMRDLKHPRTLMMHNANVAFSLIEICLLGGLPVRFQDISLAPLYGIVYVMFAWSTTSLWTDKEHGPQFLYFFFDTTAGTTATIALLVLLMVLMVAYFAFANLPIIMNFLGGGILVRASAVAAVSALVCKID